LPTGHPLTPTTAPSALPTRPGLSATTQTLTYGYDRLYRLTSASGGPSGSTTYTYDPVGNRLTRVRGSSSISYAYDKVDRITSAGATSYTLDAVGNMTVRGADCLAYDQANRLKTLDSACNSSTDASYAYDGDGKRVSKTVGSTSTNYVYDVNRGLPVLLEDGTRRYVWGLGLAYEVETATNAALVYHVDGLGSVRALTNSSKAVVQTYESDEFGVPITASGGSAQPFGFTGEQRDLESSLTYLRARYYDPSIGRLVTRDTVRGFRFATSSLNQYLYSYSSPTNFIDPSGHSSTQHVLEEGDTSSGGGGAGLDEDLPPLDEPEFVYDEDGRPYVRANPYKPGSAGGPGAGKEFPWRVKREILPQIGSEPCVYCGDPATQVDHVIPRSKGGNNTAENEQPICDWCNQSKGNRPGPNPKPSELRSNGTGGGLPSRTGTGMGSGRGGGSLRGIDRPEFPEFR
jgi:RHS repeat-associated protein